MNRFFSFIILTYNEGVHLPRLLQSVAGLDAAIFILDSGSTDNTLTIANNFGATVKQHPFENHPRQWDYALKNFNITTPWVICLDADQTVSTSLKTLLENFNPDDFTEIGGIYFNRKFIFKGQWIKHGGYYPFYQIKMFKYGTGHSDLNENMDHRFVVPGKTLVWKDGIIVEENFKENDISFWVNKHNRYSDLLALEEFERMQGLRTQITEPNFWGTPYQRTASLKGLWWKTPRHIRPYLYFFYRFIIKLGFLDGHTGRMFHFMQAFWFRKLVDVKIDELLKNRDEKP